MSKRIIYVFIFIYGQYKKCKFYKFRLQLNSHNTVRTLASKKVFSDMFVDRDLYPGVFKHGLLLPYTFLF